MPPTTDTINTAVRDLADLQRRRVEIIDKAARQAESLEVSITEHTNALRRAIEADRRGDTARLVADALAEHRVNVGELCSRFADGLERRGHTVFPHAYEPIRAAYALVTNLNRD